MEEQLDILKICNMRILAKHGCTEIEKLQEQQFDISVEMVADLSKGQMTDKLADTVDYLPMHDAIVKAVKENHYSLIERLAMDIFAIVFLDARVQKATVCIAKPGLLPAVAPLVAATGATPSIVITRSNPKFAAGGIASHK